MAKNLKHIIYNLKPKLIVILGPTASGKSDLAIKLAKKFRGEIVSADSRQVYKGMVVGTASPYQQIQEVKGRRQSPIKFLWGAKFKSKAIQKPILIDKVPHYLLHIVYPDEEFNVAIYKELAIEVIKDIQKRRKLPFLVGGTGLYIKSVIDNLKIPEIKPDWKLRKKMEAEIKGRGLKHLYEKLIKLDPEAAYIVDPKNPRRIIRALEVALKTKKPFSKQRKKGKSLFDILETGLVLPEEKLKERIEKRVNKMLKAGLIEEVKNLIRFYDKNLATFDAIGYREIIDYLDGKISLAQALREIKNNTWHFAKRQMTWFKRDKRIKWIKNHKEAEKLVKEFVRH